MKINNITKSVLDNEVKISADFILKSGKKKEIFFKVPLKYEEFIVADSGTFFPLGLMLSMKLGEDLSVEGPLPERILNNRENISGLLTCWNVGFSAIDLNYSGSLKETYNSKHAGTFFSGGVDSFYTLLKNKNDKSGIISHLILVHGFDVDLEDNERFNDLLKNVEEVKKSSKLELITIRTNLRELTDEILGWGFCHGAAIATVSLLLRKGMAKVYIPSSFTFDTYIPSGTHPDLDPLWSTDTLTIVHDGCEFSRLEKTKFISQSNIALSYLHVCFKNREGKYNCCACPKCLRTMIDLKIAGKLERAKTFDSTIKLDVLKKVITGKADRIYLEESLQALESEGIYPELQAALRHLLYQKNYDAFFYKVRNFVARFDKKYNKSRLSHYAAKRRMK